VEVMILCFFLEELTMTQNLNEVPDGVGDPDIAYFEARIAASGKPRDDPSNAKYVKIIEQLKAAIQKQILLG
jgi:hypothetical protein